MTIRLSDLQVSPAGRYAGASEPAPKWETNYSNDPAYWGQRFLDPVIHVVGAHTGPSMLLVNGAPGVDVVLDAAVTNDGFSDGPLVWLMPALRHQGQEFLRLATSPLSFTDLYPGYLDELGIVEASPDSVHDSYASFLEGLAPRVCDEINRYLQRLKETTVTVPAVPDWERDTTTVTLTVAGNWDERGRASTGPHAEEVATQFGLHTLVAETTVAAQAASFGAGLAELAPNLTIDSYISYPDRAVSVVEAHGPAFALPPVSRRYLAALDRHRDISVEASVDGADIL